MAPEFVEVALVLTTKVVLFVTELTVTGSVGKPVVGSPAPATTAPAYRPAVLVQVTVALPVVVVQFASATDGVPQIVNPVDSAPVLVHVTVALPAVVAQFASVIGVVKVRFDDVALVTEIALPTSCAN